jgi:UDP-GlcNAc3NAcA epimerase
MKIFTILGARPQFIKAAPVSKAFRNTGNREFIIHTGQHYDFKMSQLFFNEMDIPKPYINLNVGSGTHAEQTGHMLMGIEKILLKEKPDMVFVYGDTNSTIAGALAAVKLHIPVAHIEAGLRSFNREMPEEHNRVLTDHCASLFFCPTQTAVTNLRTEGIIDNVHLVGDTMCDALAMFLQTAHKRSSILSTLTLQPGSYYLITLHRASNTDNPDILKKIISSLLNLEKPVIFPVHPRTLKAIQNVIQTDLKNTNLKMIDPVGYIDMLVLEQNAQFILTDSGGIQKEAYLLKVPCITLRSETEWVETIASGWNVLAGNNLTNLGQFMEHFEIPKTHPDLYGDGRASQRIVEIATSC